MVIEVEVRSFISKERYDDLIEFFTHNAKLQKEDYQETFYFDGKDDLRIQRNNFYAKIWLKKGKIHDEQREEIEIKCDRSEFEKLEKLFLALSFTVKIKWFRNRMEFDWKGLTVCLDFTKGYGYIIELEKMCSPSEQEQELENIKQQLQALNIPLTPRDEFDQKYQYYKEHWRSLV